MYSYFNRLHIDIYECIWEMYVVFLTPQIHTCTVDLFIQNPPFLNIVHYIFLRLYFNCTLVFQQHYSIPTVSNPMLII